jgi:hypothetical protein
MKYIKYLLFLCAVSFYWSCDKNELEKTKSLPEGNIVAPAVQSMDTVVINKSSYDAKTMVNFVWTPADFGYKAATNYTVYMSSGSVSNMVLATNVSNPSYTIDHQALYDKLVGKKNLALPINKVSTVQVYVSATIGSDFTVVKSEPQNIKFKVGKAGVDGDLLNIAGDFNGWATTEAGIIGANKIYSGYVDMNMKGQASSGYKFFDFVYSTSENGASYGGSLDALSLTGGNLNATPGMKFFNVDLNTGKSSIMNFTKVGLTGINGKWATPALEMSYDYENNYYFVVTEATTDNFRILCFSPDDKGWGWSYTMGPRAIADLSIKAGSDVKVFDSNTVSKPLLKADPNMKLDVAGKYKFILYFTSTDATWHFKVERP